MNYLLILAATFLSLSSVLHSANGLRSDTTALQASKTVALQMRAEFCAKKAANYGSIIEYKLYSEEMAGKIYRDCLNGL